MFLRALRVPLCASAFPIFPSYTLRVLRGALLRLIQPDNRQPFSLHFNPAVRPFTDEEYRPSPRRHRACRRSFPLCSRPKAPPPRSEEEGRRRRHRAPGPRPHPGEVPRRAHALPQGRALGARAEDGEQAGRGRPLHRTDLLAPGGPGGLHVVRVAGGQERRAQRRAAPPADDQRQPLRLHRREQAVRPRRRVLARPRLLSQGADAATDRGLRRRASREEGRDLQSVYRGALAGRRAGGRSLSRRLP